MKNNKIPSWSVKTQNLVFYLLVVICHPFIRIVNKINWRFGRSYQCACQPLNPFIGLLQPGMVILSHKKYELTNLFIRGYWTHAAVFINDHCVIEAISKGVVKETLETFIKNVDDFIILKPKFCDHHAMNEAAEFLEKIVGYPYNFSFKSKKESFYCSELVYRAYSQTSHWHLVKREHPGKLWDFHSDEIVLPQNLLDSTLLWQVVDHEYPSLQSYS